MNMRSLYFYLIRNFIYIIALLVDLVVFEWWINLTCGATRTHAVELCKGGGICPTGNTCCPYDNRYYYKSSRSLTERTSLKFLSSCIPNDLGSYNATCCHDETEVLDISNASTVVTTSRTGCPMGYKCVVDYDDIGMDSTERHGRCLGSDKYAIDPLLPVLPRYPIHPCPQIQNVYGFSNRNHSRTEDMKKLAYYSSHGDIQQYIATNWKTSIRYVVIMIHGANRNADDYFCALNAIIQSQIHPSDVLLLVPWFISTSDSPVIRLFNGGIPFRWNTTNDASGPWRYGANAIASSSSSPETSSFALLDAIVSYLLDTKSPPQFPNIQRLVIAGHSSGGQFVQRWSLLTHSWDKLRMKSVVANPSSYAYLTPMRHIDIEWRVPSNDEVVACPDYNEWEWGIGTAWLQPPSTKRRNSSLYTVPPYVNDALARYASVIDLTSTFSMRDVVYLAGGLDVCTVPDTKKPNGWCNSHGLETSCRDMMQGSNRLERHHWYCASLNSLNMSHRCFVVPYVGHDHSLMFNSEIGRTALFGLNMIQ